MLDFEMLSDFDKNTYNFYKESLSNFKTVMEDTHDSLVFADQWEYNCMSYAFDIFDDWLELAEFTCSFSHSLFGGKIDYEQLNMTFLDCCEEIEDRFAVRRLPDAYATLAEDERMIAFRIGADDFHFARRNSDGTWTHKPGHNYIRQMSVDELLGEEWCEDRVYPYISEIAFFAIKI